VLFLQRERKKSYVQVKAGRQRTKKNIKEEERERDRVEK
jgi:hypothetical protein